MLKKFFAALMATLMLVNLITFAELSENDGVYTEDFEGYESAEEIIAEPTIISEFTKYEPELGEKNGSQVMVVNSGISSGTENLIFVNNELYDKEYNILKFKIGADLAKNQNWGSTSALVFKYTKDNGIAETAYIFDFAYGLVRHKENGVTEKEICKFNAAKMYNIEMTVTKDYRNEAYYYDVTYAVDGKNNKLSFKTTENGTMSVGFRSTSENKVYVDDFEITAVTFTRATVNVEGRNDVSLKPVIEVSFTDEIDDSIIAPENIYAGDIPAQSFEHIGDNKYSITLSEVLKKNTQYVVDLSAIRNKKGHPLKNSEFTFTTRNTAVLIDGEFVVNTSTKDKENILIVFADFALPLEIYAEESIKMSGGDFWVLTSDYRPIDATEYAQNTGKTNDSFTAEYDIETNTLEVSGKTETGFTDELVAVYMEKDGNISYTNMLKTGEDGYFSMSFEPKVSSDVYTVYAKTLQEEFSSSVKIRVEAEVSAFIETVNKKDAESINEAFETYKNAISIDLDLYQKLEDKSFIAKELAKIGGYEEIEKLIADIEVLSLISAMMSSEDIYSVFAEYESLVLSAEDEAYIVWEELSEENKAKILKTVIDSEIFNPDEFKKEIYVQSLLKMIETTNKYADVKEIIETYPNLLGITLDEYKKAGKPASVAKGLCGEKWNLESFAEEFDELVKKAKKAASSKSGGGGGGSGKSASSGGIVLPKNPPEPMDKTETTLQPEKESAPAFTDMADAKWAEEAVNTLAQRKIISGYDDGTFRPGGNITREEFVAIIVRYLGLDTGAECSFADVARDKWFYKSVAEAAASGIIKGISETEFGTGITITRQDAAVILYNIGDFKGTGKAEFTDKENIAEYAKEAVSALTEKGIINGLSDGSFAPASSLTRAQAAQLIYAYDIKKEGNK